MSAELEDAGAPATGPVDAAVAAAPATPDPRFATGARVKSRADAISVFKKLWLDHVAAHVDAKQPRIGSGWTSVLARKSQPVDATREDCGAARERIRSTFAPGEAPSVLFGELSRLSAGQSCWVVASPSGFHTLLGYLAETNGEVLLVWVPPEG